MLLVATLLVPVALAQNAESELQTGIALTRQSHFEEAIPHFLAARGHITETFALEFNLALCYVATRNFASAIQILTRLSGDTGHVAQINNLLAQAYIGTHRLREAMNAFDRAAQATPSDEKLYVYIADACFDEAEYSEGLKVIGTGLSNLPDSPRLLFERGMFRTQIGRTDLAKNDFERVAQLASDSDIAAIARAEEALLTDDLPSVIRIARSAIRAGHRHYLLLTLLAEAILRNGNPSSEELSEARAVSELATQLRPGYANAHLTLGRVLLKQEAPSGAITQLEIARELDPRNRAVYLALAQAYRRSGHIEQERQALATLKTLNEQDADRIRSQSDPSDVEPGVDK